MASYYESPADIGQAVQMARRLDRSQILMGEVNPVSLCNYLATTAEHLEAEVGRLRAQLNAWEAHARRHGCVEDLKLNG